MDFLLKRENSPYFCIGNKIRMNLNKETIMEPIINSQMPEFKVQAFQNGSFKTVSSEDERENGLFSSSTRRTSPLCARPNW